VADVTDGGAVVVVDSDEGQDAMFAFVERGDSFLP